jgi:hypothetical protein
MHENIILNKIGLFLRKQSGIEKILDRLLRPVEVLTKKPVFGCHMCGQCVLHSTGLECPMNCPKNIRNGPCGGVRQDGSCEVYPEMKCVWVKAYEKSQRLFWPHEIHDLRPPVDWTLQGTSSWVNYITEKDQIVSGCDARKVSALQITKQNEQ